MKVIVNIIQQTSYEIDITPKEYCYAKSFFKSDEEFHKKIFTKGIICDRSTYWQDIFLKDEKAFVELNDFFDNK